MHCIAHWYARPLVFLTTAAPGVLPCLVAWWIGEGGAFTAAVCAAVCLAVSALVYAYYLHDW